MKTFICNGYNNVKAESFHDAAEIFATRAARKQYGSRGYCRVCNENGRRADGQSAEFNCFIGHSDGSGNTVGHNINLWVSLEATK